MKSNQRLKTMPSFKTLKEILDSDDEFPSSFEETPQIPAYKNDHRFDSIDFKWIHSRLTCNKDIKKDSECIKSENDKPIKKNQNVLLTKDVQTSQELNVDKPIADCFISSSNAKYSENDDNVPIKNNENSALKKNLESQGLFCNKSFADCFTSNSPKKYPKSRNCVGNAPIENHENHHVLKKGILKSQDLFCAKSIADSITTSCLLWFINFLMSKDIQSNYNFLHSCLVEQYE